MKLDVMLRETSSEKQRTKAISLEVPRAVKS